MRVPFVKMHGLGNDFVVLDAREQALPTLAPAIVRALADRHEGIGCDQLILLEPSDTASAAMRIFNRDGSEVESCGNANRAVGVLLGQPARVATKGGMVELRPDADGIAVTLDPPRFDWDAIPLAYAMDTLTLPLGWEELEQPAAVNVGNPHVVFFVEDNDAVPLERLGPIIETDSVFPHKINVNVATVEDRKTIRLRVWERGAGLTRACGTGACATAVAAMRRGLADRAVTVHLPGGALSIAWREDGHIVMTGPATEAYRGSFEWDDYA
ncbi:diaminopimelate epimerase [Erythrobacter arachoides]|uniref:Diaminopimelate epimerase n=1 Tax=Aurantiacibacter arachoides TaxID=1850444 RepID=A0A845A075_9SPHN|nr:diaminopimelate epimerase [Aurantiacibacter arachoides]MXO92930.1 diaminopimelate epimerase [Aurantiacibacter arachoides]GGD53339.1 diaminopimelate epimerase [Aurantiacibacter arachoides]